MHSAVQCSAKCSAVHVQCISQCSAVHCALQCISQCSTSAVCTVAVTRNSGAPGAKYRVGPHKSWVMSLIPCWRYQTGYNCCVDSLDCEPWKSLKIELFRNVGEFCPLEFEHTFLCEIITFCNVVFVNYKIFLELGGPSALGGPLDFVHPCPMVVTPLSVQCRK